MKVEIFALCDYVVDNGNKLTIVGTFDTINTDTLPATIPSVGIGIRIVMNEKEATNPKKHKLFVRFISPQGNQLNEIKADVELSVKKGTERVVLQLAFNMSGLTFKEYGTHKIELVFNETPIEDRIINVNKPINTPVS